MRERGAKGERKGSERGSGERSGREGKESKDEKKGIVVYHSGINGDSWQIDDRI